MCGPARGPAASPSSATRRLLELGSGDLQKVEAIVADSRSSALRHVLSNEAR